MSSARFALWLALLVAVVASGIQVAYSANETRDLHEALEAAQTSHDEAMAAQSRLLIERATLAAYQNVERTAQLELNMRFPQTVERVLQ